MGEVARDNAAPLEYSETVRMQDHDDGSRFARFVVSIRAHRRTGVLEVAAEGVTTLLYFSAGRIVFAEEGTLGETLGRMLLREGALTQAEYAKVIDRMTAALVDSEQMRFGEAAIALGYLRPEQVHEALSLQVRRKLLCCFQWEGPVCAFDEGEEPLREVAHFPSEVLPLVLEGVRRFYDASRAERVLSPFVDRYPRLAASADETASALGLHPAEARLVRSLDGKRRMSEVLAAAELDSLLVRQLVAGLVLTGHVQLREEDLAAQPARTEPESPRAGGPGPRTAVALRGLAAEIARRRRAETRRSSIPPRDAQRAKLEAEQAYQRGRRHMAYEAWPLAVEELRRAVRRCPDMIEYVLCAAWAEHRTGQGDMAEQRRALEDLSVRALKKDRENAFAWHVQGQLATLEGDDAKALRSFRIAQRLDPDDREAARFVRLLAARVEPKGKGKR